MHVHIFTTGTVRITRSWQDGHGDAYVPRLVRTLTDRRLTEPLPIWSFLIEHPEGLIVVDTGIPANANDPVWFPPHMRLAQRAAPFQIEGAHEEIGAKIRAAGFAPGDVRWVVLTHLHQDHEGGLHHFQNAEFLVSRREWQAAQGFAGRMAGYLNTRWFSGFQPTLVEYREPDAHFGGRTTLTGAGDVYLVPTPGHSAGHQSVVLDEGAQRIVFAGDSAYSQAQLLADGIDGVTPDAAAERESHRRILALAATQPTVYLPAHEWASAERLMARTPLPTATG